jgi:protein gp37
MAALVPILYYRVFGEHWRPQERVHLGVSIENRETLGRLECLRKTPAAVRFFSAEPLLEDLGTLDLTGIHQCIVGGESGPGARPMHPDWVRSIRDQCQAAGVAFFFKQWGEWAPVDQEPNEKLARWLKYHHYGDGQVMLRVGKKVAGAMLDNRKWQEEPNGPQ